MKFIAISSIFALSTLVGCAASTPADSDVSADEVTARPPINLTGSTDAGSVQAKLYKLLETFKDDQGLKISVGIESAAFFMQGGHESRSVTCTQSLLPSPVTVGGGGVAPQGFPGFDPGGVPTAPSFGCDLLGFDKVRNGGQLPFSVIPNEGESPLAGKLFELLRKGEQQGGLGVELTNKVDDPPCCDIPSSRTLTISDSRASLSCTQHTGGFAFIVTAECTYFVNDTTTGNKN
jgi:hypothetical protein